MVEQEKVDPVKLAKLMLAEGIPAETIESLFREGVSSGVTEEVFKVLFFETERGI